MRKLIIATIIIIPTFGFIWASSATKQRSEDTSSKVIPASSHTPAEIGAPKSNTISNLGGGYKGAKWGMSVDQAKRHIGKDEFWAERGLTNSANRLMREFRITIGKDEQRLYCRFYKNRLYEIQLYPFMKGLDSDRTTYELLTSKLVEKYGRGQSIKPRDPSYTKCMEWDDGETRINCLKWGTSSLPETFIVAYTSKEIEGEIAADRKAKRAEAERKQKNRVRSSLDQL